MRKRPMTRASLLATAGTAGVLLAMPAVGVAADDAAPLATKYNCSMCHAPAAKLVGPSYKDIAAKYAGDAGASAKLQVKVKTGGSGVWGTVAMPPNNVPEADLKTLVDWILATK